MEFAAALLGIALLFVVIYGAICRIVERRAMRRIRETERNAAFIDARNLAVEYRNPTKDGGHVHRPPHGHSLGRRRRSVVTSAAGSMRTQALDAPYRSGLRSTSQTSGF